MQLYAHRAGRGLAPENTLFACQKSLCYPVDFIDLDIGMTRDGEIVATHDLELNPDTTRDLSGKFITERLIVASLTYRQLLNYNVGQIDPLSKYARYFPDQQSLDYAPIPRLQEVIQYVQHRNSSVQFQLEMKIDPARPHLAFPPEVFAEALVALLTELDLLEKVEVQSFDYRSLLSLHQKNDRIKTTFLTHPEEQSIPETLWTAGYHIKDFNHSILQLIKGLGGKCWSPFQMDVTAAQIEEAKNLDLKIVPWGYPEKEGSEFNAHQIRQLEKWGIDGIITDRPDLLRNIS